MSGDLYELALSVPWCITDEALEAMLSIAAREPLPSDEIARRIHGPKALANRRGQRREDSGTMTMRDGVATIPIDGPIYRYADFFTAVSGGVTTEALARDFALAMDDPAVRAVLFVIDSPGGEATGINELSDAIYQARGRKPIVAYVEGYGASAAYWIASAADLVVVDDTALVGSIGTVMGVPDPTKRISRTIDFVSTQSPKKRADPTTDHGRAYLQQLVDGMTDVFIAKVARNRNIEASAVLAAEGGLLVGQQAITAGLADELGSEEGALRSLATSIPLLGPSPLRRAIPAMDMLLDLGLVGGAKETPPMADQKEGFWAGLFKGAKEAGLVSEETAIGAQVAAEPLRNVTASLVDPAQAKATAEADAENQRLRAELTKLRAEQIQRDAQAFAKEQLGSGHAFPAEQQAMAALYARAAEVDASAPRTDGQPSNVALVEAAYSARPTNSMSRDLLDPQIKERSRVLPAQTPSAEAAELAEVDASTRKYAERANGRNGKR